MNKCVNLRNLYSFDNAYERDDIVPLKNLCRIHSHNDRYEQNGNCLLQDLFENNKLEHVNVYNINSNSNVVNSFTIQRNIKRLRFINVYYADEVYDIKLNVAEVAPRNLRVFNICRCNG